MQRSYGHRPNPTDTRDRHAAGLIAYDADIPESFSNRDLIQLGCYQFSTSTCVAMTVAGLCFAEQRRQGKTRLDAKGISPGATYYAGLRRELGPDAVLTDFGSIPREVCQAAREIGLVDFAVWPYPNSFAQDSLAVLAEPPQEAFQAGSDRDWFGYYSVPETGEERKTAVKRLLSSRKLVGGAWLVDEAFEQAPPWWNWPGCRGAPLGGHMFSLIGYDSLGLTVWNSWEGWGDADCGRIAWTALDEAMDLTVVEIDLDKW